MTSIEARKAQLEARLRELNARLRRIETELDQPVSDNFGEQAIERESEEVLEDLGTAGQQEIRAIEAALARIARGAYGICVVCGEPISEERLNVVPHAPMCRTCAAAR